MKLPASNSIKLLSPESSRLAPSSIRLFSLLLFFLSLTLVAGVSPQNTSSPLLFYNMSTFLPKPGVFIEAFDTNNVMQFVINSADLKNLNSDNYPLISEVDYYIVGTGATRLELGSPFKDNAQATMAAAILLAINDFVYLYRDENNTDLISVKLDVGGWDNNYINICNPLPCPDVLILGTTQIAGQAVNSTIISLEPYFDEYTRTNNWLLVDSFTKFTFYDYTVNGNWFAVPLTTDIRLIFYNQSTFSHLNLNPPPPNGNWGVEWWNSWNWTKFVEYATIIRQSELGYGFMFSGQYDEETKLISMIARNWNVDVISDNGSCGLANSNFSEALDQVIRPLFMPDINGNTVTNMNFYNDSVPEFLQWQNTPVNNINLTTLDPSIFCCQYNVTPVPLVGMNIASPQDNNYTVVWAIDASNNRTNSTTTSVNEIGIGFAPGVATFLGGMGLAITEGSSNKDLAWKLILHLISQDPKAPYLNIINIANGLFPPYDSALDYPPWNTSAYDTARQALKHAVPVQYPSSAVPQMSEIENAHVFRQLLLEIVLKNATNQEAIERACDVLDEILAPPCTVNDWNFTQPQFCTASTNNLGIAYSWNEPKICRDGLTLPQTYFLPCSYVAINSPYGLSITVLTGFGCSMSIIYMIMFVIYRHSNPIKMASFVFCEFILLGSVFIYTSLFFMTGVLTIWKCHISIWILVIGFGLTFGGLFVKLIRIYRIFSNKGLQIIRLTDSFLFKNLMIVIGLEVAFLLLWTFLDGGPEIIQAYVGTEPTKNIDIYQSTCRYGSPGALAAIGVLNLILIILAVGVAFATWSVPTQFNETKAIIASVFGVVFGCVVCVPLLFLVQYASRVMLVGFTIDFVFLISMAIFCVPKLYEAVRLDYRRRRRASRSTSKPWWVFWGSRHNGTSESYASKSSKHKGTNDNYTLRPKTIFGDSNARLSNSGKQSSKGDRSTHNERQRLSDGPQTHDETDTTSMGLTPLTPTVRRNPLNGSHSYPLSNDSGNCEHKPGSPRTFNFHRHQTPTLFCPHCGLGVGETTISD